MVKRKHTHTHTKQRLFFSLTGVDELLDLLGDGVPDAFAVAVM